LLSFVGIADFIDTALEKDTAVGLVAGTCSIPEEQIMTAALFALGEERSEKLHTFVCNPQKESQDSEGQQDSFDGLSLEQGMAAARARVRSSCTFACCYCCRPYALFTPKLTSTPSMLLLQLLPLLLLLLLYVSL